MRRRRRLAVVITGVPVAAWQELLVDVGSRDWTRRARSKLEEDGVVALRPRKRLATDELAGKAVEMARREGIPRGPGRWDVQVAWPDLAAYVSDHTTWLQREVSSEGCVVSYPGSSDQLFHGDGNQDGFFTAFVPLVDLEVENGPTEFALGTHTDPHAIARAPTLHYEEGPFALPLLRRGDVLVFSYQVLHRGLANRSLRPRPIYYAVLAPDSTLKDTINFPTSTPP